MIVWIFWFGFALCFLGFKCPRLVYGISERFVGQCVLVFREDIVIWVQKKTGSAIITVNTLDEAQIFLNKYHTFVVGLFHKFEVT